MAKQEKVQVDEDFMKEIISQGLPMKQEISPKAVSKEPDTPEVIQETVEEPVRQPEAKTIRETTRRKKSTPADYRETYFQKMELPDRQPIYVSRSTHEKLMKIVMVIGERKATVSSYVETIILNHFDQYQDEINELYKKTFESPI
ncbi:conjugal transfer protein [Porphyromonas macacae]|jgi:hypothetical protein|uniref:Conjugal transfer protein n=1 Tax=Porphyromonas macacae TaxID=28115 RepID=A0A0A2EFM0_9PORP|nr:MULTISPECIES: DUF3408 domain-containing protein [Porphyromonas]KGL51712.1 conjugal transfer protein [Porphyromonas canoris]KGL56629.1 conjugal transfer protein [Porphyromonas sp. COT-052 OH4946]KGN76392.1 conjugal transfer protein [Porphyromonas macacae]KGN89167.1 conjugal transfer protein [Porphyromonas gulae]KKC51378.1 conjugal transfer protein [Porphyromonas gulae]